MAVPAGGKPGWEVLPTLGVEETYTDNVRLGPAGSARSDWVTEVRPGLGVSHNGARARFQARYAADLVYRAQEGSTDVFHYLDATGNAELARQLLFIDGRASVTQQNISLLGPQAQSNVSNTANRATIRTLLVSPYLRHNFGYQAQGEARFTYSTVGVNGTGSTFANSEANRIDLRLTSGPAYKLLTWNLAYNKEHVDYTQINQSIDAEMISGSARRLVTPTLGLRATAGYEDNKYLTFGQAPKGAFWSVGPEWTPSPRTRVAATAGRRYFGPTHSLDFSHRTRLTTWSAQYSEDITTARGQALIPTTGDTATALDALFLSRIPDPVARQAAVASFISQTGLPPSLNVPLNFLTTTPFLVKRWVASFGIIGARNTVLANVFKETREALSPSQLGAGDFGASSNTKQTGTSLLWTLRITPRTSSNATVGYARNELPGAARQDDLTFIRLGLIRQLQPKVSGSLNFRRLQNASSQPAFDYKENALSVALNIRF